MYVDGEHMDSASDTVLHFEVRAQVDSVVIITTDRTVTTQTLRTLTTARLISVCLYVCLSVCTSV